MPPFPPPDQPQLLPTLPRPAADPDRLALLRRQAYARLVDEEAATPPVSRRWALGKLALTAVAATPVVAAMLKGRAALATPAPRSTAPQYGAPMLYGNPGYDSTTHTTTRQGLGSLTAWDDASIQLLQPGGLKYIFSNRTKARTIDYVYGSDDHFHLFLVNDAASGKNYVLEAGGIFTVSDGTDLFTCTWVPKGLTMQPSIYSAKGGEADFASTVASFAETMNDQAMKRANAASRAIHVDLEEGVPAGFWQGSGGTPSLPNVYQAGIDKGLLEIQCYGAMTGGTLVIDLKTKKLVRFKG